MSEVQEMQGLRLEIPDDEDPFIVVRSLYVTANYYEGRRMAEPFPDVIDVEILVVSESGHGISLKLGPTIFLELYEKMSGSLDEINEARRKWDAVEGKQDAGTDN